jgi:hypothetical protein
VLGCWKNYEDLEESLTIEELVQTFEKIMDNRSDHYEFLARIQGIEVKSRAPKQEASEAEKSGLVERLKQKKEKEMQAEAQTKGSSKFADGVGYQVVRG